MTYCELKWEIPIYINDNAAHHSFLQPVSTFVVRDAAASRGQNIGTRCL